MNKLEKIFTLVPLGSKFSQNSHEITLLPSTTNLNAFCQVGVQLLSKLRFQVYWKQMQYVVCMTTIFKQRIGMVDPKNLAGRTQDKFLQFH